MAGDVQLRVLHLPLKPDVYSAVNASAKAEGISPIEWSSKVLEAASKPTTTTGGKTKWTATLIPTKAVV